METVDIVKLRNVAWSFRDRNMESFALHFWHGAPNTRHALYRKYRWTRVLFFFFLLFSIPILSIRKKTILISAEFSQRIGKPCGEYREPEDISPRCNCTRCVLSRRSSRAKSAASISPRGPSNSISSPAISLPKIKGQPRACSRSCGRISNVKKQMDASLSSRIRSTNSCCERLKRREYSSGDDESTDRRRQVDQ